MSVPSALFAKLFMSKAACDKWLASPIKFVRDYDDWPRMNPEMASLYPGWRDEPQCDDFMSVAEFLSNIADYSRHFRSWYDDVEGAYFVVDAKHGSRMAEIAASVAALRGAENFSDVGRAGFVYVFPAIAGGDPEVLLRIERGKSRFLFPNDSSPETLYFANEAEEFIETMLEEEQ
ncbi:MAG: hypothetical protein LBB28_05605 [Synergistaceae bacterium]|nr:hypothetical protein [Synergistaceae bacterium]